MPTPQQAAQVASLAGAMFAGATKGATAATAQQPPAAQVPPVSAPQIPPVVPGAPPTPSQAMMQKLISDSKAGLTGPMATPSTPPTGPPAPGGPQPPPPPSTLGDAMAQLQADRARYEADSSNPPQYKPPNKWLEIATALAGLAFPAGGLGKFAAGMSGGLAEGAENAYARKEEQWKAKQAADEKAMGLDATLYDAQAKIDATAQQNAIRNEYTQQRIDIARGRFNESVQSLGWKENVQFPETLRKDYDLATERANVTMRGQNLTSADRLTAINAQFKLQAIRDVAAGARTEANISARLATTSIAAQAKTLESQFEAQKQLILKSKMTPDQQSAALASAYTTLNGGVSALLAKAPPGSDMANLSTLSSGMDTDAEHAQAEDLEQAQNGYLTQAGGYDSGAASGYSAPQGVTPQTQAQAIQLQQKGYSTDPATGQMYPPGYQALGSPIDGSDPPPQQGPGTPTGAGAPGTPIGGDPPAAPQATNPAEQHGINLAQQSDNYVLGLGAMAQKAGVGGGAGVSEPDLKSAREFVAQHAADHPTLQSFIQSMTGPGAKLMSNPQAGQLIELWAHTRRAQGKPVDVPPPPGQTPPHPVVPGSGPASLDITKPGLGLPGPAGAAQTGAIAPETAPPKPSFAGLPDSAVTGAVKGVAGAVEGAIHHATPTKGEVIQQAAQKYGVPVALAIAIAKNESSFNNDATSPVGAHGMFQLMPGTAKALGVDPNNPVENVMGGIHYLAEQLHRFKSIPAGIAAYNAGPQAVIDHRGIPPFPETRAYVAAVLKDYRALLQEYPLQAHGASGSF
jgi:hypothetical protein